LEAHNSKGRASARGLAAADSTGASPAPRHEQPGNFLRRGC